MKKSAFLLLLLSGLVLSCGTAPKPPEAPSEVEVEQEQEPAAPEVIVHVEAPVHTDTEVKATEDTNFDPHSISEARFETTKKDIVEFVSDLNGIIRTRDYNAWLAHLSPSYFDDINSRAWLNDRTEDLYTRDKIVAQNLGRDQRTVEKRILNTARDYFELVVVPSRANDRVDDISFLSDSRVRAYTVDERRGTRLVLYDLVYINNRWLIAN
jgi:hypothetical protein